MKKIAIALAALAVMAAVASAAVYSQNAVGFINKDAQEGHLYALTMPFVNLESATGSWLFRETQVAKDAPAGSFAYFWDGLAWQRVTMTRQGFTTDYELKPGECFFFQPGKDMTIVLAGEVPADSQIDVGITAGGNLSAVGNPYPVSMKFVETELAKDAKAGSFAYFWDGSAWQRVNMTRQGFTTEYELEPGEGFFFQTATSEQTNKVWVEERPYNFPTDKPNGN